MEDRELMTTADAAEILGISDASVRNWIRQGLLHRSGAGVSGDEVRNLKGKITSGELNRLNRRANKKQAGGNPSVSPEYDGLCRALVEQSRDSGMIIWLLVLRLLKTHGLVPDRDIEELSLLDPDDFGTDSLLQHMKTGFERLSISRTAPGFREIIKLLEDFDFVAREPALHDTAGMIYQTLRRSGERAVSGSFYTPPELAGELVESAMSACGTDKSRQRFLDPCCGSGQFLLCFIRTGGSVRNICGIDSDQTAVFIAASNIFIQKPDIDLQPNIICADSLKNEHPLISDAVQTGFDIAVTNPPWGAVVSGAKEDLREQYPGITSGESFSYFINRCLQLTREGGTVALVLPESVTNVGRHCDIRNHILRNGRITRIERKGRIFRGVFTPVITMQIQKSASKAAVAVTDDWKREIEFNININSRDVGIIDSVYNLPHTTLRNKADWALGIVTGDNGRFLNNSQEAGFEPVIRGGDIESGRVKMPELYIRFEPEKFQQTAPVEKYRSPEKLVYRFISNRLVFAKEPHGLLTINSANILIPDMQKLAVAGCRPVDIAELFNSDLYSFIYQKRFNSLKILRSHLEELPLPLDARELYRQLSSFDLDYIGNSV